MSLHTASDHTAPVLLYSETTPAIDLTPYMDRSSHMPAHVHSPSDLLRFRQRLFSLESCSPSKISHAHFGASDVDGDSDPGYVPTALGVKPIVNRMCLPWRNTARHTSHAGNQLYGTSRWASTGSGQSHATVQCSPTDYK
jgi:hypothetical protein